MTSRCRPAPRPATGGDLTLRALIERVVRAEVAAFAERQEAGQFLKALSAAEIDEAAAKGRVRPGGSELEPQAVDSDAAVDNALCAFADGIYLVSVDGRPAESLDQTLRLSDESRVASVRLTLLAGG